MADLVKGAKEATIYITYVPQATYRVNPATRCASTLSGHTDSILTVAFSPEVELVLASGSRWYECKILGFEYQYTFADESSSQKLGHVLIVVSWWKISRFWQHG